MVFMSLVGTGTASAGVGSSFCPPLNVEKNRKSPIAISLSLCVRKPAGDIASSPRYDILISTAVITLCDQAGATRASTVLSLRLPLRLLGHHSTRPATLPHLERDGVVRTATVARRSSTSSAGMEGSVARTVST